MVGQRYNLDQRGRCSSLTAKQGSLQLSIDTLGESVFCDGWLGREGDISALVMHSCGRMSRDPAQLRSSKNHGSVRRGRREI